MRKIAQQFQAMKSMTSTFVYQLQHEINKTSNKRTIIPRLNLNADLYKIGKIPPGIAKTRQGPTNQKFDLHDPVVNYRRF